MKSKEISSLIYSVAASNQKIMLLVIITCGSIGSHLSLNSSWSRAFSASGAEFNTLRRFAQAPSIYASYLVFGVVCSVRQNGLASPITHGSKQVIVRNMQGDRKNLCSRPQITEPRVYWWDAANAFNFVHIFVWLAWVSYWICVSGNSDTALYGN